MNKKDRLSESILSNIRENTSVKKVRKSKKVIKEAEAPEIVFTVNYNGLSVWKSRKEAINFYKDCAAFSEGAEKERYTILLLDLMDGADFAVDNYDDDDSVWEINWMGSTPKSGQCAVATEKLEGHQSAKDIVGKIKSGKIMPPKEFLNGLEESSPRNKNVVKEGKVIDGINVIDYTNETYPADWSQEMFPIDFVAKLVSQRLEDEDKVDTDILDKTIQDVYTFVGSKEAEIEEFISNKLKEVNNCNPKSKSPVKEGVKLGKENKAKLKAMPKNQTVGDYQENGEKPTKSNRPLFDEEKDAIRDLGRDDLEIIAGPNTKDYWVYSNTLDAYCNVGSMSEYSEEDVENEIKNNWNGFLDNAWWLFGDFDL